jgi:PIN domain nuclease of toxin-antitoxin system
MRVLIDTHVLIWYLNGDNILPVRIVNIIENERNKIVVSTVSLWEITIKLSAGKLEMFKTLQEIKQYFEDKDIELLDINFNALLSLLNLPYYHKDPFDRLLISQAIAEDLSIISADKHFEAYPAKVIWQ